MNNHDALIDRLAGSLEPVRPISPAAARAALGAVAALSVAAALAVLGPRGDLAALRPAPMVVISGGLFALLGLACGLAATRMARPAVGRGSDGWRWALAATLLLPVAAIGEALLFPALRTGITLGEGLPCLLRGLAASTATAAGLAWWLRRGAPARVDLAAWLVGLTAGAVGAVAIALTCPDASPSHVGLWHGAIVLVAGAIGRLALPRVLRW